MAESFTLYIHKGYILNANQRLHWAPEAERKKVLRQLGNLQHRTLPKWTQRVKIDAYVSYPARQPRDVANLHPTMKTVLDGLVDGGKGILPDDNDSYVSGPFLHPSGEKSGRKDWYRFDVTITELDVHTSGK
jgi:hypothetical protein